MKRVVFRSILLRYIISYAIVMAVLYVGVGIYVSSSYATAIHASIVDDNTNRLSALCMQHEEKLNAMLSIANQISLSPYTTPFKLDENPMKAYHLKQQLLSYNVDNFFDQLYVIFHEDNYLYSSNTSASLDMFTEQLIHYEGISPGTLRELLQKQGDNITILPSLNIQSVLTSDTNKQMATIIIPLRLDGRFTIGNALFLVPENTYQRLFADEIYQMRNMYILYRDQIISATRRLDISDDVILNALSGQEKAYTRELITDDGVRYILFVQSGSLLEFRYVSLFPQETVEMQTARSRLGFALFMLMLTIPCSLLTVYFARRHVRPIKELQRTFGSSASTGDGFTAIRSGIETLIGQNKALHTQLDESMAVRKANFIKNFVKGRYEAREKAVNTAAGLGLHIDRAFFCVSLMTFVQQDSNGLNQLYALAAASQDASGYGMDIVEQEQYLFVMFADNREALEAWAEAAKAVLSSLYKEAVVAGSNIHTDFTKVTSAYLEASTAYDNRFVMGNDNVLWFSDVSVAAKDIEAFSRGYLEGFRKALYAGNAHALNDRINELFQVLREKKFSLFAFRMIYNDLISMLLNKYLSYDGVKADTLQYYDIFELSRCRHVEDLVDTLRQLCSAILNKEEENAPQEQSVIRQVIDYIREHYTDPDLSMGAIADTFGISASRLSLEYKELTGMYPSDYLLLVRMEKAKELLAKTRDPIQDIGAAVGYYDPSGFIRRFKKHMNMTPAQYRQSLKVQTKNNLKDTE